MVTKSSKLVDSPVEALTLDEVRCFLEVTPCPSCQTGPLVFDGPSGPTFTCQACEGTGEIEFSVEYPLPDTIDPDIPWGARWWAGVQYTSVPRHKGAMNTNTTIVVIAVGVLVRMISTHDHRCSTPTDVGREQPHCR